MKNKTYKLKRSIKACFLSLLGTLRSNDADGNQKVKKGIGFVSKKINLHVHHAFFTFLCPFLHDYDVKMSNFAFYGVRKQATAKLYFSF